jgi:hypothetical protein
VQHDPALRRVKIVEPKALKSELMKETARPSWSTTDRQMVSVSHGARATGHRAARSGVEDAANVIDRTRDRNSATSIAIDAGSAIARSRNP